VGGENENKQKEKHEKKVSWLTISKSRGELKHFCRYKRNIEEK